MKYIVTEELPLLEILQKMYPDSSTTSLRSWVKEDRVTVDGGSIKNVKTLIKINQEVAVNPKKKFLPYGVQVIYDDSSVIVIQKPAGLLSVSTDLEKEFTAHSSLKQYYHPRTIHVVHRLDQDTSGLMIFALNEKAYNHFKKQFETHEISRRYCAIAEGHLSESAGTWSSYLYEDSNYIVHSTKDKTLGKLATTHYRVLGTSKQNSWLDIKLETGRKNQIRVHTREAGHPLVGDKKYGATMHTKRLYLHAYALTFEHPDTKKIMTFKAPIPDSFYKLVNPQGDPTCTTTKFG
ncbi:MAG: RluA family pseudouridine synthase [Chlamydiota bacterium]|nr:RluA family pseudouridine synthase [Chlamydiota bacterium]